MQEELQIEHLLPSPEDRWREMLRFMGWNEETRRAAARSVEILFRRGHELVVQTYEYLRSVPETAAILGWEENVDEAHLEERRRFFTVWLARTLGMDTSDEFACYLFRAGKYHAGHGPRHIHTPPNTSSPPSAWSRHPSPALWPRPAWKHRPWRQPQQPGAST